MVEGAGLENRYIRKGIEGSNPSLSASNPSNNVQVSLINLCVVSVLGITLSYNIP